MFEQHDDALLPRSRFLIRQLRFAGMAAGLFVFSLGIGMAGYHHFGPMGWIDSLLNASMILTGMGPVNQMTTSGGKLFASFYALFSGVVFLTCAATLLAPPLHRLLHRFHIDDEDSEDGK